MTLDQIRARVFDRCNRAAMRFFALGFNVIREELANDDFGGVIRFQWRCMCGRVEAIDIRLHLPVDIYAPNVYDEIERLGATTESHLRNDGFAPEIITEILERGARFDAWFDGFTRTEPWSP